METHTPIPGLRWKGPAQRSLFGPVDRERLRADCQAALRRDLEEASRRWGFDFVSDRPLEQGDFHWEGIPSAKVPLLYRPSPLGSEQEEEEEHRASGGTTGVTTGGTTGGTAQPGTMGLSVGTSHYNSRERVTDDVGVPSTAPVMEKTPEKDENVKLKRKQTNITGRSWDVTPTPPPDTLTLAALHYTFRTSPSLSSFHFTYIYNILHFC